MLCLCSIREVAETYMRRNEGSLRANTQKLRRKREEEPNRRMPNGTYGGVGGGRNFPLPDYLGRFCNMLRMLWGVLRVRSPKKVRRHRHQGSGIMGFCNMLCMFPRRTAGGYAIGSLHSSSKAKQMRQFIVSQAHLFCGELFDSP